MHPLAFNDKITLQYNAMQRNVTQHNTIQIQVLLFISNIEHNYIMQQQFLPNIGMVGKGVDRRRILLWSTPNID